MGLELQGTLALRGSCTNAIGTETSLDRQCWVNAICLLHFSSLSALKGTAQYECAKVPPLGTVWGPPAIFNFDAAGHQPGVPHLCALGKTSSSFVSCAWTPLDGMASLVDGTTAREEQKASSGQTSDSAWALEGDTTAFKKALNPTFDLYRYLALHREPSGCHQLLLALSHVLDVSFIYPFRGLIIQRVGTSQPSAFATKVHTMTSCQKNFDNASSKHA